MSAVDLCVAGGRVFLDGTVQDVALGITDGQVTHVITDAASLSADHTLELEGEIVVPGFVDGHVHFREPGYEEKEGIVSGSAAAAAGGVTTIVEMPNTTPPVLTVDRLLEKRELFADQSHVDYALFGALTEENVGTGDIQRLADAGVTAFKTFMATSFGPLLMDDKGVLYRAFEEVAETERPVYVHAEDQQLLDEFSKRADDADWMDAFLDSRPPITETTAIADVIEVVRATGAETIIPHVTTSEGLEQIARARKEGLPISAEVTPYHLVIDDEQLREIGTPAIGTPPVRSASNRAKLIKALEDGTIQLLGSDHAPHTLEQKRGSPLEVAPGMPQLETAVPALLDLAANGKLSIKRIVECYSAAPARVHGLYPRKGTLRPGADADFVVIDLDRERAVNADDFESSANYSPFDERVFTGSPVAVYQRGERIAEDGVSLTEPGAGRECIDFD